MNAEVSLTFCYGITVSKDLMVTFRCRVTIKINPGHVSTAAAAAAAVVYVVVVGVVAVPARCRTSPLNTRKNMIISRYFLHTTTKTCMLFFYYTSSHRDRGVVRVCATV